MEQITDKMLPHNVDAERAVLGAILIDPDAYFNVSEIVNPRDFYVSRHGWIYWALAQQAAAGNAPDYVTTCDILERKGQLADIGGAAYLTGLVSSTPTAFGVAQYAKIVARTAYHRRVIAAAQQITQLGFEDGEINEKQAAVEKIVAELAPGKNAGGLVPLRDVLGTAYNEIAARTGEMLGVKTGFIDYDNLLGGLQKSDLVIVAGRPSMGKTAFMMGMASYAAQSNNVAFFSLEMSSRQLAHRLIAANTGIDSKRLRLYKMQDDDWPALIGAINALGDCGLWIDDTSNCTISHIRTQVRKLAARVKLDAVFVDYLQLMSTGRGGRETQIEKITMLSAACKNLARELDVPVVVGSQLSRACEQRNDKRPMLSDLRDSGTIEQDADIVSFIYRDVVYNPNTEAPAIAEIITAKHRNGPIGKTCLRFEEQRAMFQNLEVGK